MQTYKASKCRVSLGLSRCVPAFYKDLVAAKAKIGQPAYFLWALLVSEISMFSQNRSTPLTAKVRPAMRAQITSRTHDTTIMGTKYLCCAK